MKKHVIVDRTNGKIIFSTLSLKRITDKWEEKKKDKNLSWYEFPV